MSLFSLGVFGMAGWPLTVGAADETAVPRFRESVAIETNLVAQRQFELARVHLVEQHWKEGVSLIRQVAANDSGSLVALGPGRYVNVGLCAQLLLASLPPEGLAVARAASDNAAKHAYDEGLARHDEGTLRAIVRDSFVARSTDQALSTLGDWAWQAGDITKARAWWGRMLPLTPALPAGTVAPLLRYPDTGFERASVLARLALCSIVEGDAERAAVERAAIRRRYPESRGRLGMREDRLTDRLDELAAQAHEWKFPPRDLAVSTFGVNAARNGVLPREIDVGTLRWAADFAPDPYGPTPGARPAHDREGLDLFPVSIGDVLLVSTSDRVLAWNVRTGKPAWQAGQNEGPAIYPSVPEMAIPLIPLQLVGSPRYTMTIDEGRLFFRLGSPITTHSPDLLRESDSQLVCLDLARGEGKLIWKVPAAAIDPQAAIEGSPVVADGRAFLVTRKGRPQMQTSVVCLDADTGRRIWDRVLCAALATVGMNESLVSHQLLTVGDDAVYLATASGAIGAVEADNGHVRWLSTYPSETPEPAAASRRPRVTSPCLFAENMVFAAPNDFDGILALDSRTGLTLWQRAFPGRIEHLLGANRGVLIASGESLWGLDLHTGNVLWHVGFADPGSFGFGRGILAGNVVYWPTREDIYVAEQSTGQLRRRIPLLARYVEGGGNLSIAGDFLIVAQPQRITVYGPESGPAPKKPEKYTQTGVVGGRLR